MAEKDLLSSSDESDEDFVPENEIHESLSEESHSSDNEEAEGETSNKKKKVNRKRRKDKEEEKEQEEPEAKKKEIDINALWADFKEDVNQKKLGTNNSSNNVIADKNNSDEVKKTNVDEDKKEKLDETQVKKLPGKNIPSFSNKTAPGKGLASVLNKIGKKDKLSTLEKSKLDWNKFKQSEGIDEEIKTFNRGKDGYLEKQDFLQRTDLRQFEIEKQLRTTKRSLR